MSAIKRRIGLIGFGAIGKDPAKSCCHTALSERTSGPSASRDALGSSAPLREAADGSMKS